jgi:hypothetical protein
LLVIAFIGHLLDGYCPIFKTHRLFLFDFGTVRYSRQAVDCTSQIVQRLSSRR